MQVFEGLVVVGAVENVSAPDGIGLLTSKTAHYPGAQQLILWLPQSGYFGYRELVVVGPGDVEIERVGVRARLNGSVQILFDTLSWAPGAYRIEISHDDGWRHVAALEKLAEGVAAPVIEVAPSEPPPAGPIVYRDGFGKVIADVDLELRAKAAERLAHVFGRRLEFEGNFRGGVIVYVDGARRIRFSHEMAGAPYKFSIDVPGAAHWEKVTGAPLAERDEILRFVAEQVQREKASIWTFEIRDTEIVFR